jgi:hypothetical protein
VYSLDEVVDRRRIGDRPAKRRHPVLDVYLDVASGDADVTECVAPDPLSHGLVVHAYGAIPAQSTVSHEAPHMPAGKANLLAQEASRSAYDAPSAVEEDLSPTLALCRIQEIAGCSADEKCLRRAHVDLLTLLALDRFPGSAGLETGLSVPGFGYSAHMEIGYVLSSEEHRPLDSVLEAAVSLEPREMVRT